MAVRGDGNGLVKMAKPFGIPIEPLEPIGMPLEGLQFLSCLQVPKDAGSIRTGDSPFTVRGDGNGIDVTRMPLEGLQLLFCLQVRATRLHGQGRRLTMNPTRGNNSPWCDSTNWDSRLSPTTILRLGRPRRATVPPTLSGIVRGSTRALGPSGIQRHGALVASLAYQCK